MTFSKNEAKLQVQKLVEKFNQIKASGRVKGYNEENTKKDLITPLFRALGWDVENNEASDEVTNEDRISKGRVDYAFRINSIPKFFLEAKAANKGLDEIKDAQQAINYAWHKGTTWAVLTDFQTLVAYNSEVKGKTLADAQFIRLSCEQFIENFEKLWWLSKEAFQAGLLDKEATGLGKKLRKIKVDEQLLQELMHYREVLSKNIIKNNSSKNLSESDIDESVQRIIDRLIFIRTTEDRQVEPSTLLPKLREFEEGKKIKLTVALKEIYLQFDKTYNSKLFTFNPMDLGQRHLCETLEIDEEVLAEVIRGLYQSRDGQTHYDFSLIDADILGNIYEQYLSHILSRTAKRAKVESKEAHRKEQGIYYTPTYIVNYIVKNTLGELLKKKKPNEVEKLKVLDMACGSGSFLLKAFDTIDEYYKKRDKDYAQTKLDIESEAAKITRKITILKNNIYGVDLDPKAVEIAQLNLLLKAAETKHRLPDLRENIKCGNSLIDKNLSEDTRAFDWDTEFKEIMAGGGFDVIIGNPPYIKVQNIDEQQRKYFVKHKNASGKFDVYLLFLEKSFQLVKEGGIIGFITPSNYLKAQYGKNIRSLLSKKVTIKAFIDFGDLKVFSDATTYPSIIIFEKSKPDSQHKLRYVKVKSLESQAIAELANALTRDLSLEFIESYGVMQSSLSENNWSLTNQKSSEILEKIKHKGNLTLGELSERIFTGVQTSADKEYVIRSNDSRFSKIDKALLRPYLFGKDVRRWVTNFRNTFLIYPHEKHLGKTIAISPDEMKSKYSKTWSYLNQPEIKRKLQARTYLMDDIVSGSREQWYEVWCQRDPGWFSAPKILTPALSDKSNFVFDDGGHFFVSGSAGVYGIMLKPEYARTGFYRFLLALLNSNLIDFFIRSISPMFSGGYYKYNTQYLAPIPVVIPTETLVNKLSGLSEKLEKITIEIQTESKNQTDLTLKLKQRAKELQAELDNTIYDIYGLTAEERQLVEDSIRG